MPYLYNNLTGDFTTITAPTGATLSGTVLVKTGEGILSGIFCTSASTTPTLIAYDNTAASGTVILASFTPVSATLYQFGPLPIKFKTGLYVGSSGSVGCTIIYS
jgi:hypothetical protein